MDKAKSCQNLLKESKNEFGNIRQVRFQNREYYQG